MSLEHVCCLASAAEAYALASQLIPCAMLYLKFGTINAAVFCKLRDLMTEPEARHNETGLVVLLG